MAFQPTLPFPVAIWDEHPLQFAALALAFAAPYVLADGEAVFLATGDAIPAGAVVATVVDSGLGYDQIVTGASAGRRPILNGNGVILLT